MHQTIEAGKDPSLGHMEMQKQHSNRRRRTSHQTEKDYLHLQTAETGFIEREGRTNKSPTYQLTQAEFEAANWLDCVLTSKIPSQRNRELEASNSYFGVGYERRSLEQHHIRRPHSSAKSKVENLAAVRQQQTHTHAHHT